ncbi:MAG: SUF system NifU family Fe-S cluster assembly protein [Candidatus Kerfeldbacteria bacterium]|nr:SUF system NifU family Fe-S cluster assembly protein [Candidatus Kerfeldbacteria bacterium]
MELYREIILEHFREPHNKGHLDRPDRVGDATNTTCGDKLTLEFKFDASGRIADVAYDGQGCAISQASASLLTDEMRGKTMEEIAALTPNDVFSLLGGPVAPGRQNCALLILRGRDNAFKP